MTSSRGAVGNGAIAVGNGNGPLRQWQWSLRLLAALLLCGPKHVLTASSEELMEIAERLQDGSLDADGLALLEAHAQKNPEDWRTHAMIGQARGFLGVDGAASALRVARVMAPKVPHVAIALARQLRTDGAPEEAVASYQVALELSPTDGSTYIALGEVAATLRSRRCGDGDVAAAAWSTAIELLPQPPPDLPRWLALHLSKCGVEQRSAAIKAGEAAVKLAPKSAEAYEALGAALFTGTPPANLTAKSRTRAARVLRAAIKLRADAAASTSQGAPAAAASGSSIASSASAAALAHYRLSRVLATDPSLILEDGKHLDEAQTALMNEAVELVRAAARLDPAAYEESAKPFRGWEEAVRQNRQADHWSFLERNSMVKAMHGEVEGKQLEAEEDRAILQDEASAEVGETRWKYDFDGGTKKARRREKEEV
jgi:tetratricopeptide (TPR) repeat protein